MGQILSSLSSAGSAPFAVAALLLFFTFFVGIVAWTYWPGRKEELERQGRIPFERGEGAGASGARGEE